MTSIKFAEAKLKSDLSNYLDWSKHMTSYLRYQKVQNIIKKTLDNLTKIGNEDKDKAYIIIKANYEAET